MLLDANIHVLKSKAVKIVLYLTDMSEFKEINTIYKNYFGLKPPVRVCVELPQ